MVEFIRYIPGPVFLAVYFVFALLCVLLARTITYSDGTSSYAPGDEASLDPVAVALLQGGTNAVIRSRVLSLVSKGLVVIEGLGKKTLVRATGKDRQGELSALDLEVLSFLSTARAPGELFKDKGFRERVEDCLAEVKSGLEGRRLLRSPAQRARALRITLFFGALIVALGGLKLYLGLMRGKPVAFLVISILVYAAAMAFVHIKGKGLTGAGRDYLKNMRERLSWTLKRKTLPQGVDPALLVGLYGAGHMYVSSVYPQYTDAFKRNAGGGSGCTGGCGGGGCSGGGGGGGGCGGCGGD